MKLLRRCKDCGIFITRNSDLGRCRSCSKKGRHNPIFGKQRPKHVKEAISKTRIELKLAKGKNNPNFGKRGKEASGYIHGNGYLPYPTEFTSYLKSKIKKRDDYTCQLCGITKEINPHKRLEVHHIDYNKQNCKEYNLITLCRSCHTKTNGNRKLWKETFNNLKRR